MARILTMTSRDKSVAGSARIGECRLGTRFSDVMPRPGSRIFEGVPAYTVKPRSLSAWILSIGCPIVAVAIRWGVGFVDPTIPPFPPIFAATLLVAILAGKVAGGTAALVGLLAAWLAFADDISSGFTASSLVLYVVSSLAIVAVADQYRRLLRKYQDKEVISERQMHLIKAENSILSRLAEDASQREVLELICRAAEDYSGHAMHASVLLLDPDGRHLRHGAAPSLPDTYNDAIDGQEIGPSVGSCGTAAFRKQPVFVTDIASDPLWADYRELALSHGLRACWSVPILSTSHGVLGTFAVYHRVSRAPSEEERDTIDLMSRIASLVIDHQRGKDFRQLLINELTHRVKNLLSVVLSLASSSLRGRTDEAAYKTFENRLRAMAETQSLLSQSNWSSVDFGELAARIVLDPFSASATRISLDGPSLHLPGQFTLPLALSLHELSTNATKYGALACDTGRVDIRWGLSRNGREFVVNWIESGGPPVEADPKAGFGTRMIKSAFSTGDVKLDYRRDGLVCEIKVPLP